MAEANVGEWGNVPANAFLYFPKGQEIIVENPGKPEKQWRKIFGGQTFSQFERDGLTELERELTNEKVVLDPFFDTPNKLRFLQANKFKVDKTVESMVETTKWRSRCFPVQVDSATANLLNSGAFYFCGRDNQYRPILAVDIGKFKEDADEDESIQNTLVVIMEFMVSQLMIEGQVENYVLIMNLEKATFSLRGVIMKILSFTSNAYRGRLFSSYILSMPTVIRWGWEAIVSKFVSENTLKKLKLTGDSWHEDMWTHISRAIVEQRYGGDMPNLVNNFWPPRQDFLLFTDPRAQSANNLITSEEYGNLWNQDKLLARKVLRKWVKEKQTEKEVETEVMPIREEGLRWTREATVLQETRFQVDDRAIRTFFQNDSYARLCRIV